MQVRRSLNGALSRLAFCAAAALCFSATPAMAETVVLEPVTKWVVDWGKESCALRRGFGDMANLSGVQLEQFFPGLGFQLLLTSDQFGRMRQTDQPEIHFGNIDDISKKLDRALIGKGEGEGEKLTLFVPSAMIFETEEPSRVLADEEIAAREAAVDRIAVESRGRTLVFKTGAMDKVFAAMRQCTNDLAAQWGFDEAKRENIARMPVPRGIADWLRPADYPFLNLRRGDQALVNFRLMVDETGKPTECVIQRSYSDKNFDDHSCELLMKRARFEPALDQAGKPVAAYHGNVISWIVQ